MTRPIDEDLDHCPLFFGKYQGKTPDLISQNDPGYIVWLYENVDPKCVSKALYEDCQIDLKSYRDQDDD